MKLPGENIWAAPVSEPSIFMPRCRDVAWSDAENRLIIASGPLAGLVHGSGTFSAVTKGPMSNGATSSQAEGEKVKDLLNRLARRYPGVSQLVFDLNTERLAEEVMIGLNGHLIQLINGLETKVNNGDISMLFPIFQGG